MDGKAAVPALAPEPEPSPLPTGRLRSRYAAELLASGPAACLVLAALLVVLIPLFLRMPPTVDVAFFRVCARNVLAGGILERDTLYIMAPGPVWVHTAALHFPGEDMIALRALDLTILALIATLLVRWQSAQGLPRAGQIWLAVALVGFYLTVSEWCHCQPDLWMTLPALAALHLRCRQLGNLLEANSAPSTTVVRAALEGACWGAGCLIKPFVFVPAFLCWLLSARLIVSQVRKPARTVALDLAGLLIGGSLAAACWIAWLGLGGGWYSFARNFYIWSGHYYTMTLPYAERIGPLFTAPPPWGLLHALALPFALVAIGRCFAAPVRESPTSRGDALLACCYLGWLVEGSFWQSQNHYHLVPGVVWGIALLAGPLARLTAQRPSMRLACVGLLLGTIVSRPALAPSRLALWPRCWREPTTPALWDALALDTRFAPDWQALERVAAFLRTQEVGQRQVTCYSLTTAHLYMQMGLEPSTRFLYLSLTLYMYPQKQPLVLNELKGSDHRFIVSDVRELGLSCEQAEAEQPGQPLAFPPEFPTEWLPRYPWSEPIVFRAGRYYVHRVR